MICVYFKTVNIYKIRYHTIVNIKCIECIKHMKYEHHREAYVACHCHCGTPSPYPMTFQDLPTQPASFEHHLGIIAAHFNQSWVSSERFLLQVWLWRWQWVQLRGLLSFHRWGGPLPTKQTTDVRGTKLQWCLDRHGGGWIGISIARNGTWDKRWGLPNSHTPFECWVIAHTWWFSVSFTVNDTT